MCACVVIVLPIKTEDGIYDFLKPAQSDETDEEQAERIAKQLLFKKTTVNLDSRALSGHRLFSLIEDRCKKLHAEKIKKNAGKSSTTVAIVKKAKKKTSAAALAPSGNVPILLPLPTSAHFSCRR